MKILAIITLSASLYGVFMFVWRVDLYLDEKRCQRQHKHNLDSFLNHHKIKQNEK